MIKMFRKWYAITIAPNSLSGTLSSFLTLSALGLVSSGKDSPESFRESEKKATSAPEIIKLMTISRKVKPIRK